VLRLSAALDVDLATLALDPAVPPELIGPLQDAAIKAVSLAVYVRALITL
jgi:hypothetical protein